VRIGLSDEQEMLRSTTRQFLQATAPTSQVREWAQSDAGFERVWWKRAAELGWCSLFAPEEFGGGGLSGGAAQDAVILAEELGRALAPGPFLPTNVVVDALSRAAPSEARGHWLPALVAGEAIAAWALADPTSWDGNGSGVSARRVADGYVLAGEKLSVEAGADADLLLVSAHTDDGAIQLVVPSTSPGITAARVEGLDIGRRLADVRFADVEVPAAAVLAEPGPAAERALTRALDVALTLQSAESVGLADRVFEFTFEYMKDRYSYGRPISSYQALKHAVADMLLKVESAKATADAAADSLDADGDPTLDVTVAAAYVKEAAVQVIQGCVQILGGISMTWEHDVHLYLRRATQNRVLFGTPDQHREKINALST
jgi:alkylation response protein AidB-like acyl-CoA dehydrogenase